MPADLTVIGVGSTLMGDDGVGPLIIGQLAARPARPGPTIEYLDGGAGGLRLLNWIEQANRLFFVDAADFRGRPGQCRLFDDSAPRAPRPTAVFSLHQADLLGVLDMARQFYRVPPCWLLAIQIESVQQRQLLSDPLSRAFDRLVEVTRRLAQRLACSPIQSRIE